MTETLAHGPGNYGKLVHTRDAAQLRSGCGVPSGYSQWHNGCTGGFPRELAHTGIENVGGLELFVRNRTVLPVVGRSLALPISLSFFIIQLSLIVSRGAVVPVIAIQAEADRLRGGSL